MEYQELQKTVSLYTGANVAGFDYTYICYRKVLTTLDFQTL